jgi:hypothetical protein
MNASTETLDRLSNELATLVSKRKEIVRQEDEIKERIIEELKNNDRESWTSDQGRVTRHSRVSYRDWDLETVRKKVGETRFPEVTRTTVRFSSLREKLEEMGVGQEEAEEFYSSAATRNESEWVVYRPKS